MKVIKILLGLWILFGGVAISGYSAYQLWNGWNNVSGDVIANIESEREWKVMDTVPTRVFLPSLKVDLEVVPGRIINDVWEVSETKANYLVGSGVVAKPGNMVIYAHKRPELFASLHKIEVGNQVVVESRDLVAIYNVVDEFETHAGDLGIVDDSDTTELTLYTCNRWDDSTRYVVKAKLSHYYASGLGGIIARNETSI